MQTSTLSALSAYWALRPGPWLAVRIAAGFLSFVWLLVGWRALARVIYRLANKRDM